MALPTIIAARGRTLSKRVARWRVQEKLGLSTRSATISPEANVSRTRKGGRKVGKPALTAPTKPKNESISAATCSLVPSVEAAFSTNRRIECVGLGRTMSRFARSRREIVLLEASGSSRETSKTISSTRSGSLLRPGIGWMSKRIAISRRPNCSISVRIPLICSEI